MNPAPPPRDDRPPTPATSPVAPRDLARMQEQFGRCIDTPFEFSDAPGDYRLQTERYAQEIVDRMVPRGAIPGAERSWPWVRGPIS